MENELSVDDLASQISDGATIAIPAEQSLTPMALVRALVRRGVRDLHVLCVPIGGLAVDVLIGAGCVHTVECAAVSLGEFGLAPRFSDAVENGSIIIKDSTCPAIHSALQASEKGVPFMPLSGLIGSDILASRNDWKIVDDPMEQGNGPIVLLPAIRPDFALIHSLIADRNGNTWIGRRRELVALAHAAKTTLATAESISEETLIETPHLAAGSISGLYISGIAEARLGAWPVGLPGTYNPDRDLYEKYARQAQTQEGFDAFLNEFLIKGISEAAK
tara:strand:+ start:4218 stop:5045 length:828 start_codon:yes stop_codon:yes gene_type:complete